MMQLLPTDSPDQPVGTAVQPPLEDELRTREFPLQKSAQWLLHDVGDGLIQRIAPDHATIPGRGLRKLQRLGATMAQVALSSLQSPRQIAAPTVLDDAAYRQLDFPLAPVAQLPVPPSADTPSRTFTNTVYWLTRHAVEQDPATAGQQIVREQAINEVYWRLTREEQDLIARTHANASRNKNADARDHRLLCAALVLALLCAQPLRDAKLPPWGERPTPPHRRKRHAAGAAHRCGDDAAGARPGRSFCQPGPAPSLLTANGQHPPGALQAALSQAAPQPALTDELSVLLRYA